MGFFPGLFFHKINPVFFSFVFRCRKVIRHLRDDYRRRSDYVSYLIRAKQGLLSTINFLEKATERSKHEGETYSHYLVSEWIRLRLEEPMQEEAVNQFSADFRSRRVVDEKIELLERFSASLLEFFVGNKGKAHYLCIFQIFETISD